MTDENVKSFLVDCGHEESIIPNGYPKAFIGCTSNGNAIYIKEKIIETLMEEDPTMSDEDAWEFYDFNIEGAYVGQPEPIYISLADWVTVTTIESE
jgi:hypothetical protein